MPHAWRRRHRPGEGAVKHLGITLWGFGLGYREAVDLARRAEDAGFQLAPR